MRLRSLRPDLPSPDQVQRFRGIAPRSCRWSILLVSSAIVSCFSPYAKIFHYFGPRLSLWPGPARAKVNEVQAD